MPSPQVTLDAATLSAFSASLAGLPQDEIRKAKILFLRNAITDFRAQKKTAVGFLWVMGILSIIPVFLVVFIPAFFGYRASNEASISKIQNALDVWREDIAGEYDVLVARLAEI